MKKVLYNYNNDRFVFSNDEIDFSLLTACLHVGYKCNLSCPYCFNQYENDEIIEADSEELFSAIDKLGIQRLVISGGEPFLYQETLLNLLTMAKKYNVKTLVSTNGTLINQNVVDKFSSLFDYVDVSIPATTREGYESFRGSDGFTSATNAIRLLLDSGVKVRLTYTVSHENRSDVDNLPTLVKQLGVNNVRIGYVYGTNREILDACNVDDIVNSLENAGVTTYKPITGKLLDAYNKGYVILRLNGNAYLTSPDQENFVTNVVGKDRNELIDIFEDIAVYQRELYS